MTLTEWALKHGVTRAAIADLHAMWRLDGTYATGAADDGEAAVQRVVRLEASRRGHRLWRNNVGAGKLDNGSFLRWGLANESPGVNKVLKSSDIIGIRSDGVFMAREIKAPGWRYAGDDRERAQLAFIQLVTSWGGDACFATGEGTIR
jgi:hypothetical protein